MSKRSFHRRLAYLLTLSFVGGCANEAVPPAYQGTGGSGVAMGEGTGGRPSDEFTGTGGITRAGGTSGAGGITGAGGLAGTPDAALMPEVPAASFPPELVGTWRRSTSLVGTLFSFETDGSYVYAARISGGSPCIVISAIELTATGVATATAGQLMLTPSKATNVEINCAGTRTPKNPSLTPSLYPYRVIPGDKPTLELTYSSGPGVFTKE